MTRASLLAQLVKNLPAMEETRVRFLDWEDSLEQEMATHSSILAWRTLWSEEPGGPQSMGSQESNTPLAQRLKRLPVMWETWVRSLGGEDPLEKEMATHSIILAWRILVGCSPWGRKESDMTEQLHSLKPPLYDAFGFPGGASGKRTRLPMQETWV